MAIADCDDWSWGGVGGDDLLSLPIDDDGGDAGGEGDGLVYGIRNCWTAGR